MRDRQATVGGGHNVHRRALRRAGVGLQVDTEQPAVALQRQRPRYAQGTRFVARNLFVVRQKESGAQPQLGRYAAPEPTRNGGRILRGGVRVRKQRFAHHDGESLQLRIYKDVAGRYHHICVHQLQRPYFVKHLWRQHGYALQPLPVVYGRHCLRRTRRYGGADYEYRRRSRRAQDRCPRHFAMRYAIQRHDYARGVRSGG